MFGEPNFFLITELVVEPCRNQFMKWSALRVEFHIPLSFVEAVRFPRGFESFNPIF